MRVIGALVEAALRPQSEALALQQAFDAQKRLDMFDIQCQSCGGLGVVMNLADWACDEEGHKLYGAMRCPACDGLGSPRANT